MTSRDDGDPTGDAGWHADPFGRHQQRWWDGGRWTEKIRTAGVVGIDPPGIDPRPVAPGSEAPVEPLGTAEPVLLTSRHVPGALLAGIVLLTLIVALVAVVLVVGS